MPTICRKSKTNKQLLICELMDNLSATVGYCTMNMSCISTYRMYTTIFGYKLSAFVVASTITYNRSAFLVKFLIFNNKSRDTIITKKLNIPVNNRGMWMHVFSLVWNLVVFEKKNKNKQTKPIMFTANLKTFLTSYEDMTQLHLPLIAKGAH